jgi:DNA-binding MarR family transcriptional regulator
MSNRAQVPDPTTLLDRDCCLCRHGQRAAGALARRFDGALRSLGLTKRQFSLLMSLNRPQSPAMAAVASLLAMDRTTLTAALKPWERPGLVTLAADPENRRSRLLTLTPNRMIRLAEAVPIWEQHPPGDRGASSEWRPESPSQQFELFVQRLRESTPASRGNAQKRPTLR